MRASALLPLLALVAGVPARAEPQLYRLDPDHTFVMFEVLHFGTSTLRGRFGPIAGHVRLDPEAGSGSVGLRVRTDSLSTGVKALDRRMCEPDLLDCAASPEAFFVAQRFEFDEQRRVRALHGEFTVRGTSQPLTLAAQRFGCRHDERLQREVCGGDFEGSFKRSDFGIPYGLPFVADRVRLLVQVEGILD